MNGPDLEKALREILIRGEILDSDMEAIDSLCAIVFNRHFSKSPYRDDLFQEGRVGIVSLVADGNFDPSRNAINFCYTKVRNCMSNIYNQRRPLNFTDVDYYEKRREEDHPVEEQDQFEMNEVSNFVHEKLRSWQVDQMTFLIVSRYFDDKLGIRKPPLPPCTMKPSFHAEYDFYVGLLEVMIVERFSSSSILSNDFYTLFPYLGYDEATRESIDRLKSVLSPQEIFTLCYILSGQTLRFIPRQRMSKADSYFSIYKDWLKFPDEEVLATKYGKAKSVITSIVDKFTEPE